MRYKWNYEDDLNDQPYIGGNKPKTKPKRSRADIVATLVEQTDDAKEGFNPSFGSKSADKFNVSRHEREWIFTYLSGFYEEHLIVDVLKPVKGGKEATVYCCEADPVMGLDLLAAKVYRPRIFRNLRNDSLYRMGRTSLDANGKRVGSREARALENKTRFGQNLRQSNWLATEVATLEVLHAAGADVPRVYANNDNAILMDYLGEVDWPAPVLQNVTLSREEARPLFDRLVYNIDLMLMNNRIHGDLSAHNILYWEGKATIIDFPQAVNPDVNPYAYEIFERDVTRVCQYFEKYGITGNPGRLARDIWAKYIALGDDMDAL
ncbi:MAG: RIO1 family regulatory kinase/ATPase [Chloroflexota bacterium]